MQIDAGGPTHEPGQRLGPYRLEQLLGSGGMGEVYRAFDERLDRHVALKQIRGSRLHNLRARRRFRREARAAAGLNHPTIVQIHDIVEGSDADWIVMELVEGRNLAECLRSGIFEVPHALELLGELAAGLETAHRAGVVHRDLKAENVMLTGDGRLKILDFGLAKQILVEGSKHDDQDSSLSLEGTLLGTARSMAPEQALGKPVDHRSDLFSLGTLAYEMVTGKSPFLAPTAVETAIRVCSHHPTPVHLHNSEVPRTFSELIERLLEKEPDRRPGSAAEVGAELAAIAAELGEAIDEELALDARTRPALSLFDVAEGELSLGEMEPASSTVREPSGEGVWLRSERRHVTVLYCDLVTKGPEPLDPEDFYEGSRSFRGRAEKIVARHGGYLTPSSDHRLVAYFGFPLPRLDAAARAVRAALELLEGAEVPRGSEQDSPIFEARAAVHGGTAMVRAAAPEAAENRVAEVSLGPTLDVASTLLLRTAPGTVLVSEASGPGLAERFELEALRSARLRGRERPLVVARVLSVRDRDRDRQRRFDAMASPGAEDPRPWVGRQGELALIVDRARRSAAGRGQAVAVCAELGMGASRLLLEAFRRTGGISKPWVVGNVSDLRPRPGGLARRLLRRWHESLDRPLPRVADHLRSPAGEIPSQLTDALLAYAREQPLTLIFEDLQWADAESLAWITDLIDRCHESAVLVLVSYRPGLAVPWGEPAYLTRIALPPLGDGEMGALLSAVAPHATATERRRLVGWAAGRPRALMELVSTGETHGRRRPNGGESQGVAHAVPWRAQAESIDLSGREAPPVMPAALEGFLVEQMARLEPALRNLVRLASALEGVFPARYLEALSPFGSEEHHRQLASVVTRDILTWREHGDEPLLGFAGPLLRHVAYRSLVRRDRQRLHRRIADLLMHDGASDARLAIHLAEAGDASASAAAHRRAAQDARREGDRARAVAHLEAGLEQLRRVSKDAERDRRELALLTALGPLLSALRGFDDPALEETYGRATELCLRQADDAEQFQLLRGIGAFFITRARPRRNLPLLAKLHRIAERSGNDRLLCESAYAAGLTYFALGELAEARSSFESGMAASATLPKADSMTEEGEDPAVGCRAVAALVAFLQGSTERAIELSEEAVTRARRLGHPSTLVAALALGAWLHQLRRDPDAVRQRAEEALGIARSKGLLVWATHAELLLGWARSSALSAPHDPRGASDRPAFDPARFENLTLSLEIYRDHGVLFAQTYLLSLLAEIAVGQGQHELAFRYLLEALTAVEVTGEAFWQAELLRSCGALILDTEEGSRHASLQLTADDSGALAQRHGEAEGYFERSLEVARRQGAAAIERRAARDLARRWHARGLEEEARRLLEELS